MYWRIKRITPEMVARQYSVHAILIVSVLFNLVLFSKVSSAKALNGTQKQDYDRFARQVTGHLFDATYLTFTDSMNQLNTELANVPPRYTPMQKLRQMEMVPRSIDELKTMQRELTDWKSVSSLQYDMIEVGQPQGAEQLLPVTVKVKFVAHDTKSVRPAAFKVKYLIGSAFNKQTNETKPVVLDLVLEPYNPDQQAPSVPQG